MKTPILLGVRALTFAAALGLGAAWSMAQEANDTLDTPGVVPSGAEMPPAMRKPKPAMPNADAANAAPAAADQPAPAAAAAKFAPKAAAKAAPAAPAAAAVKKPAGTPAQPAAVAVKKAVAVAPNCKGLDQTACGAMKACGWVVPKDPNDATGKVQEPYCRATQKAAQKKPAAKKATAAKAAPAVPTAAATTAPAGAVTGAAPISAKTAAVPAAPAKFKKLVVNPPADAPAPAAGAANAAKAAAPSAQTIVKKAAVKPPAAAPAAVAKPQAETIGEDVIVPPAPAQ